MRQIVRVDVVGLIDDFIVDFKEAIREKFQYTGRVELGDRDLHRDHDPNQHDERGNQNAADAELEAPRSLKHHDDLQHINQPRRLFERADLSGEHCHAEQQADRNQVASLGRDTLEQQRKTQKRRHGGDEGLINVAALGAEVMPVPGLVGRRLERRKIQ